MIYQCPECRVTWWGDPEDKRYLTDDTVSPPKLELHKPDCSIGKEKERRNAKRVV